jgi:hypothetical protein
VHAPDDAPVEPGLSVMRDLVAAIRRGLSITALPLTLRLLRFSLGRSALDEVFELCWARSTPELYADLEARNLAGALRDRFARVPHLVEVLAYELALLDLWRDGTTATVAFTCVPGPLLDALRAGRLPPHLEARRLHPAGASLQPHPAQAKAAAVAAAGPPARTTSPTDAPSAAAGSLVAR